MLRECRASFSENHVIGVPDILFLFWYTLERDQNMHVTIGSRNREIKSRQVRTHIRQKRFFWNRKHAAWQDSCHVNADRHPFLAKYINSTLIPPRKLVRDIALLPSKLQHVFSHQIVPYLCPIPRYCKPLPLAGSTQSANVGLLCKLLFSLRSVRPMQIFRVQNFMLYVLVYAGVS